MGFKLIAITTIATLDLRYSIVGCRVSMNNDITMRAIEFKKPEFVIHAFADMFCNVPSSLLLMLAVPDFSCALAILDD